MFNEIKQYSLIFTMFFFFNYAMVSPQVMKLKRATQGHVNAQVQVKTRKSSKLQRWDFLLTAAQM